jgi:nitrite reductase/ring-hydroxylating ferredoxin subunit
VKRLCSSAELSSGRSIRFELERGDPYAAEGFAYRASDGAVRAFVNVCPHRAQPLDLGDGALFDALGEIECQAHGARFDPSSGRCSSGPCMGSGLRPIGVEESGGEVRVSTTATA